MKIITQEMMAHYIFKNILTELHGRFLTDGDGQTFDQFVWNNLRELGETVYTEIGNYFGDCDEAAIELGLE